MNESGDIAITCKNCGHLFEGKYCNRCGEKVYSRHDKTMIHLFEESAHFITHFDGSFFNTFRAICTSPGKLSVDYCYGVRKKYFKPISFFLLLVVLYLLFNLTEGLSQRLFYYPRNLLYGHYAIKKIQHVLITTGMTMEELSKVFHEKAEKVSKLLLLILIPASAAILQLFTFRKKRLFFDQVIFATEINIVVILFGFMLLPLIVYIIQFIVGFFVAKEFYLMDAAMSVFALIMVVIYFFIATRKFYKLNWLWSCLLTIGFFLLYGLFFQFIYKFILFLISISLVH
ncbi:MAG: DUF3667 domain-containing protein [Ginsengibacter sp.]